MKNHDFLHAQLAEQPAPDAPTAVAYRDAVRALADALLVGTAFEVYLAFRATLEASVAMFRASANPADQLTAIDLEHELAAVDRDLASRRVLPCN